MNNIINWFKKLPGWVFALLIFGILYLTGLHTEVIGQVQRIILATGIIKPDVEEVNKNTSPAANAAPTRVADYNFNLRTLTGEQTSLESLRGKVIFMNFWATWCPPCIAEMPNIQSLYEKVNSDKIAFVMVSLDQDPAKAQKFIQKRNFTFPVYTPNGPLPAAYEAQVIPTTFIISPEGQIVARKDGMADYDNQEFREFLLKMTQPGISLSNTKVAEPKLLNSQEAKKLLIKQPKTIILDVRTGQEFAGGHLNNALNFDYNNPDFVNQLSTLDKTKPYLVYCAVGGRSSKAAKQMQEMGFQLVYNVTDGFPGLKKAGLPFSL
ncbi:redoxin domain-containing protein [Adhaeribacter rhizoryzae]|uniref:redoxin domain-containing protein n=1 Tax=Adhaeribacter rhizoryzae TaxID=2607907 RepID=UPI00167FDF00|nr:redoxin domain-containing protein [Adhaeribacter rhizoryzae]